MPNIFGAGRRSLLETLAQRDADRMLMEDRARRGRLDEENRLDRQKDRELRDKQITSMDEDRDARAKVLEQAGKDRSDAAAAKAAEQKSKADALDAYTAAIQSGDEAAARVAGAKLLNLGGHMLPEPKGPIEVSPGSSLYDPKSGKSVYTAPERTPKPSAAEKDDPSLPLGTKRWLESIAQQAPTVEEGRQWLNQGWQGTLKDHPKQELAKAVKYLDSLYTTEFGVKTPIGGAPAAGGRASGAGPAGGGAAVPPPADAPMTPGGEPTDEQAIAALQAKGKPVTPETIAMAKALLKAGK